jgi:hypothetical protein
MKVMLKLDTKLQSDEVKLLMLVILNLNQTLGGCSWLIKANLWNRDIM